MSVRLSRAQQAAMRLNAPQTGMIAGAGAGKTHTLVELVLRDLRTDRIAPERIAVVTFTRAAAEQLAARLASELSDAPQQAGRLRIGTIDALCQQILAVPIATDHEWHHLQRRAVDACLDSLDPRALDDLLSVIGGESRLIDTLLSLLETLHTTCQAPEDLLVEQGDGRDDDELLSDLREFASTVGVRAASRIRAAADALEHGSFAEIPAALRPGIVAARRRDDLTTLQDRYAAAYQRAADIHTVSAREMIRDLLSRLDRELDTRSRTAGTTSFTGLQRRVLAHARSTPAARNLHRVYLDEAQDTSRLQHELLCGLLADDGQIMVVGDSNQSIYAFRNADADHFNAMVAAATTVQLSDNFRSHPDLVHAVNGWCALIPELATNLVEMQPARDASEHDQGTPRVTVMICPNGTPEEESRRVLDAALRHLDETGGERRDLCVLTASNASAIACARHLRSLGEPVHLQVKARLLDTAEARAALPIWQLQRSLHTEEVDEGALLQILSSSSIRMADRELHRLCTRPGGLLAATLTHPATGPRLRALVEHLSRAAAGDAASWLPSALHIIDPGRDLSPELVEEVAVYLGELGPEEQPGAAQPIVAIDDAPDDETSPVTVMTVHNAKGLEFPFVVFIGTATQAVYRPGPIMIADGKIGLRPDSVWRQAHRNGKRVFDAERARLAYVALTRAQERVWVSATCSALADGQVSFATGSIAQKFMGDALGISSLSDLESGDRLVGRGRIGLRVLTDPPQTKRSGHP